jgi:hypothetical protein
MKPKKPTVVHVVNAAFIPGTTTEGVLRRKFPGVSGSGYCFVNGERDMSWNRFSAATANRLAKAIRSAAKKMRRRIKVSVYTYED